MLHRENQIRQYHDGSVADLMNFFILTQTPIEKRTRRAFAGRVWGAIWFIVLPLKW